jgi:hypothetical protein
MMNLIVFIAVIVLGIVGNIQGAKSNAFTSWHIWFLNVLWVVALKLTAVPIH